MSRFSKLFVCLLAFSLAGCYIRPRNMPVAPVPLTTLTPAQATITPPWVMTATQAVPGAGETAAITPTQAATPATSEVKAVLVKDDVRLRTGPGADYDVLGLVHPGMTLLVTGKSSDGAWWQVQCDQGPNNLCWVSADPALTEPTTPP